MLYETLFHIFCEENDNKYERLTMHGEHFYCSYKHIDSHTYCSTVEIMLSYSTKYSEKKNGDLKRAIY